MPFGDSYSFVGGYRFSLVIGGVVSTDDIHPNTWSSGDALVKERLCRLYSCY